MKVVFLNVGKEVFFIDTDALDPSMQARFFFALKRIAKKGENSRLADALKVAGEETSIGSLHNLKISPEKLFEVLDTFH